MKKKKISSIERICIASGIKMTQQRMVIAKVLLESKDHPDIDEIHKRAHKMDPNISLTTVYRTMNVFEECGAVQKLEIKDSKSRYEPIDNTSEREHHHHLVDVETGEIIEFYDCNLEELKVSIARNLGYKLVDHRLELYGVKIKK